ncbi:MAG: N-acetylmuramoyl-L-alanine amidase [Verrucomicrobiia bacterium]
MAQPRSCGRTTCFSYRASPLLLGLLLVILACVTPLSAQTRLRFNTVVVDAGHGGHDRGGIPGQRVPEKVVALDTAVRLAALLRQKGLKVVMTRTSDVFVPLSTRTAIANRQRSAILVSVHYNSARRVGAMGLETFYYKNHSRALAMNIQRQMMRRFRTENRGVKQRGFYILRNTRIPAVLVECGFLTNPTEGKRAMSPQYRQIMAEAIAAGILATR